jgi:hypothetical protein
VHLRATDGFHFINDASSTELWAVLLVPILQGTSLPVTACHVEFTHGHGELAMQRRAGMLSIKCEDDNTKMTRRTIRQDENSSF